MTATVNVPGVGQVQRRYIFIGGAVVAVIVGGAWIIHLRRKGSGEITYDPATGSVTGSGGYQNPVPNGPDSSVPVETVPVIDTNAEWGTAAVEALTSAGWDRQFAAIAIGKYLSSTPVTKDEELAVRAAWGMLGRPPVDVQIILQTTGSTPGSGPPAPPPPPPPAPKPAAKKPRRYVITKKYTTSNPPWQSTLSGIAAHTPSPKPSVAQLANWNGIKNPNVIGINQTIWVDPPGDYKGTQRIG